MKTFASVLGELMSENSISASDLSRRIHISDPSLIYKWLKGEKSLLLPTAVKVADCFRCSLDYLFGLSDDYGKGAYAECPPFDIQLRKTLSELKVSQYRLLRDKVVGYGNIDSWLNKKRTPHIESVVKLARYLGVTMDYLVGREK